jgi:hypothetical protein
MTTTFTESTVPYCSITRVISQNSSPITTVPSLHWIPWDPSWQFYHNSSMRTIFLTVSSQEFYQNPLPCSYITTVLRELRTIFLTVSSKEFHHNPLPCSSITIVLWEQSSLQYHHKSSIKTPFLAVLSQQFYEKSSLQYHHKSSIKTPFLAVPSQTFSPQFLGNMTQHSISVLFIWSSL